MARNMQPIAKRCKALGISPAVMGYAKKETNRNPGGQMRKKKSEYGIQLNEKQKVKFIYGILEKQFHSYYEAAAAAPGKAGDNLLINVERRLDNVVYRLGFAMTRRQARQLVNRPLHRQRPQGRHPLLSGEGRRRHRGGGEQPLLRGLQAPHRPGRPHLPPARVAGAGEERPEGHRDPPPRS